MTMHAFLCLTFMCLIQTTSSANILLMPIPHGSHFHLGIQVGVTLHTAGHSVWMLGGQDQQERAIAMGFNYIPYDVTPMYVMEEEIGEMMVTQIFDPDNSKVKVTDHISMYTQTHRTQCLNTLGNQELMRQIQKIHGEVRFDLVVSGTTIVLNCLLLIPYKFNIPYVVYQPADSPWDAGITSLPSFQPSVLVSPSLSNHMTFSERLKSTLYTVAMAVLFQKYVQGDVSEYQALVAPEKTPVTMAQLRQNAQMWFITSDNACLDYPTLSSPHYRKIGGITLTPPTELTGELKEFTDGATDGLILITFGSTTIGAAVLKRLVPKLLIIAPRLKQRIILQYLNDDTPTEFPENILFRKWLPMNDILGHKNIIATITHGGANGQMEAIYHGVPSICIGLHDEQRYNCHKLVVNNYGLSLSVNGLTLEHLTSAIHNITQNPVYSHNVARCSSIMHDLPSGKHELTFWVDHVLKYGASHLRPSSADMPFYQLYMIDILCFTIVIAALLVVIIILLPICIWKIIKISVTSLVGFFIAAKLEVETVLAHTGHLQNLQKKYF